MKHNIFSKKYNQSYFVVYIYRTIFCWLHNSTILEISCYWIFFDRLYYSLCPSHNRDETTLVPFITGQEICKFVHEGCPLQLTSWFFPHDYEKNKQPIIRWDDNGLLYDRSANEFGAHFCFWKWNLNPQR